MSGLEIRAAGLRAARLKSVKLKAGEEVLRFGLAYCTCNLACVVAQGTGIVGGILTRRVLWT